MSFRVETTRLSRVVLATEGARHVALGVLMVLGPALFFSPPYEAITQVVPLIDYGVIFCIVGAYCFWATYKQGTNRVRRAYQASAIVTVIWVAAFIAAAMTGTPDAMRVVIPYAALLMIDFAFVATSVQKKGPVEGG